MHITFITTGGTIDKVYFDAQSRFEVGETTLEHMLRQGEVAFEYVIVPLMRKDSLHMTDEAPSIHKPSRRLTNALPNSWNR